MRIGKTLKNTMYCTLGILYLTGFTEWVLKTFFQIDNGVGPEPLKAQIWILRFHGSLSLAVLMLIGYVLRAHVAPSWKTQRGRKSGLPLLIYLFIIIFTVPFLMYLTDENLKATAESIHAYLGLSVICPFLIHFLAKKRQPRI
ncbi:MAG: hypothetical protein ACXVCY_13515 [Pseudobdellovibrionaceae bacterium]